MLIAFTFWGGCPRIVFSPTGQKRYHKELLAVLMQPEQIKRIIQRCTSTNNMLDDLFNEDNQWLTHMYTDASLEHFYYEFASTTIAELFFEAEERVDDNVVFKYHLREMESYLRLGRMYEKRVLSEVFNIGSRHTIFSNEIEIKNRERFTYNKAIISDIKPNTLYIPSSKNCVSSDFVFPPFIFQVTIAERHSILPKGIKSIKNTFPSISSWFLVWIVPPRKADIYSRKKYNKDLFEGQFVITVEDDTNFALLEDESDDSDECSNISSSLQKRPASPCSIVSIQNQHKPYNLLMQAPCIS